VGERKIKIWREERRGQGGGRERARRERGEERREGREREGRKVMIYVIV
jgi:hypothetical protein